MKNLSYSDEMLVMLQREGGTFRAVRWGRAGVSSKTKCNKRVPPTRREMQTFSKRSERLSASLGEGKNNQQYK